MSRIYDALKKLEAERARKAADASTRSPATEPAAVVPTNGDPSARPSTPPEPDVQAAAPPSGAADNGHAAAGNGNGNGAYGNGNGYANGHGNGNGHGDGNGNGKRDRRVWWRLFASAANGGGQARPRVALNFELGPEVEEAYQRLGTNLLISPGADATPRLLGLTASRHGEGTTTTSVVFASVLARRRAGRVAVVEANFRSPSLDSVLGVRGELGFADLVQGRKSLAEVAHPTQIPNLFALPCGRSTLGPPALFESSGIVSALAALRAEFDFVLFDLPPTNVYGDTSILVPRLDGALIVIEADRARISEVERVRRNLDRVGGRIVGSILNRKRNYIPAFIEEML